MEKLSTIDVAQDIGVAFYLFGNGEMEKKGLKIVELLQECAKTKKHSTNGKCFLHLRHIWKYKNIHSYCKTAKKQAIVLKKF